MKPKRIPRAFWMSLASRSALAVSFLLAAGLCWSGCKSAGSSPEGMYTLVSVNGSQLPAVVAHDRAKLEVRSGSFTFNNDGTCRSRMNFVPPMGKEVTREVNATFTQTGSKLTMKWENAGMTTGTIRGDTFTMNNEGMILSYRK